jgi:molybdate-binding protein/DNA-binding XRE family transcriptional regulator
MSREGELRNQLKAVRTRLKLSQQELATAAGIARQTIGGIEAGTYALSLTVALRLAKALGCPVEELFWLDDTLPTVEATLVGEPHRIEGSDIRVALTQIDRKWVASPLMGEQAFRREMLPVDGIADAQEGQSTLTVRLLDAPEAVAQTVWLAGCTPALSLWARSAQRWYPGLRVHWRHANSMAALHLLAVGGVHGAGLHLYDPRTGADNATFVRQVMPSCSMVLVHLGEWDEGLVVAPGNPKKLHSGLDLAQSGVRIINRENGAGARLMLDAWLTEDGIPTTDVVGYDQTVPGHIEVAEAVQSGAADAGISTAAVAAAYGLSFVPIRAVRYDLALRKDSLDLPSVQQLLGTLHHRYVRSQLEISGGYRTASTGDIYYL